MELFDKMTLNIVDNSGRSPKILLVVSPSFSIKMLQEEINNIKTEETDFTKSVDWRVSAPMGILYIAGALRKSGFDVHIYDLHRAFYICRKNGYFKEKELSNFFNDFFEKVLMENKIDVIGISCLFNVASTTVEQMGSICKRVSPDTKIVLGGHYATIKYKEVLEKGICDYVILGEAEEEFVWFIRNLNESDPDKKVYENPHIVDINSINNAGKKPAIIENLDSLALPAWDILPHYEEYIDNSLLADRIGSSAGRKIKSAGIFTTRGCPMRCTFCGSHAVHGRKLRVHSIDYIMEHIKWLVDKFDINNLLIDDDMFNYSPERTIKFCTALLEKYPIRFNIEFPNGLAIWRLNEEVIKHLKLIGAKTVTIGIESGNEYVQKNILKKNLDLSMVKEKVELLKKYGFGVRSFFIIGFIDETPEMMKDTIQFALDLNLDWSEIKVFTPLAGSEMYDLAVKKDCLIGDTSEHVFGRCCVKIAGITPEEIENLRYDANIRINFLNNRNLREGRFEVAQQVFSKLLSLYPNHIFAQWGLWKALEGQGKINEANRALKSLLDLTENNPKNQLLIEKYNIRLQ